MKLSSDEILYLDSELKIAIKLDLNEEEKFVKLHTGLRNIPKSEIKRPITIFYSKQNKNLVKFLCNKFGENEEDLYSIHQINYPEGWGSERHKDTDNDNTTYIYKTVLILLSENFLGGETLVNDKIVNMLKIGDFIHFNGSETWHEVKKIKKGNRKVLVLWFSQNRAHNYSTNKNKISLI